MIRSQKHQNGDSKVTKDDYPADDAVDLEKAPFISKSAGEVGSGSHSAVAASKKDISDVWIVTPEQSCVTRVLPFTQVEGNNFLVYGTKRGSKIAFPQHCILGPDFCCSFVTTSLIVAANLYWGWLVIKHSANVYMIIGGVFLGFGLLTSYSKTAYTDPGIIKRLTKDEFNKLPKQNDPVCRICNIYRPIGTGIGEFLLSLFIILLYRH